MKLVCDLNLSNDYETSLFILGSGIIDWGDGNTNSILNTNLTEYTYTYPTSSVYNITIEGNILQIGNTEVQSKNIKSITKILDFSNLNIITSLSGSFKNAVNLEMIPQDIPNTVQNISSMFDNCQKLNDSNISNWNISNVTNISYLFSKANIFNQDLNNWDTSNVTNMSYVFSEASSFNGNIGNWNTSNVTNMSSLFYGASSFNGNLNNWNTGNVTNMSSLFYGCSVFNQNLNNWNTGNVTNMSKLFTSTTSFNGNIGSWNTSNVISMEGMFNSTQIFNSNISGWNTSKVTDMGSMFLASNSFNSNINTWNVSNVINMKDMFGNSKFNQDLNQWDTRNVISMETMFAANEFFNSNISNWNVSNVSTMVDMFNMYDKRSNVIAFNSDISNWNVSNVTTMYRMFQYCNNFNQDLSKWNISNVTTMGNGTNNIFTETYLSPYNFNKMLNSWANLSVKSGITIVAPYYSSNGIISRNKLINTYYWTINSIELPIIYSPNTSPVSNNFTFTYVYPHTKITNTYKLKNSSNILIGGSNNNNSGNIIINNVQLTRVGNNELYLVDTTNNSIIDYITINKTTPIPCLLKGTIVLTPYGFIKIEDLKEGQEITTHKGTFEKIIKIFHTSVQWSSNPSIDKRMYKLNGQLPLYISHWHKILRSSGLRYAGNGTLECANKEELCGSEDMFELYHIQLNDSSNNHLVVNHGIIVESWNGINQDHL